MNNMHLRLLNILLLVLGFAVSPAALAQKIQVNSANPASAVQGTSNLVVEIAGGGFDSVDVVKFLLPCDVETCTITGGIDVDQESIIVHSRKKLTVNIDVAADAVVADFDIEVLSTSRGRGGKGTTLFKVTQAGGGCGGSVDPTFDVLFVGDMAGSGTDWIQPNNSAKNIRYFYHDHPHIGTGEIGLSYFQDVSGPFGSLGENCFGTDDPPTWTQVVMGMITQTKSGDAAVGILFVGKTDDGQIPLDYDLTLEGTFADRYDWTPEFVNTVILTSWRLRVAHKRERKEFSNISCVGGDTFETETFIHVVRTP